MIHRCRYVLLVGNMSLFSGIWVISRILIDMQVLENRILEKERELEAEVIQRDHVLQEKFEVLEVYCFLLNIISVILLLLLQLLLVFYLVNFWLLLCHSQPAVSKRALVV